MKYLLKALIILPFVVFSQSPEDIFGKAIQYHDPGSRWNDLDVTLYITETRPDKTDRKAIIYLNNTNGSMKLNRNDEEVYEVDGEQANVLKGEYEASRGLMLRNYYLYLWGLPMKLLDEVTPEIQRTEDEIIENEPTDVLRVAYEKDIWYFNFDKQTGRLLQYRFYKDEQAGKGELITLEDEITVNGIKIPQKRSWYTLPEMQYLGTDILSKSE